MNKQIILDFHLILHKFGILNHQTFWAMLFETQLIGEGKTETQLSVRNSAAIKSSLCKVTDVSTLWNLYVHNSK